MADSKNGAQTATSTAATEGKHRRKKITKVDAVRRAMEELGADASRPDIQGYVRQKFGVAMSLDHISNCKSVLAKRAARQRRAAKAAAQTTPESENSRAATAPIRGSGSATATIRLEDVLIAKELLDRVGAGPLKTLIDGLAR